MFQTTFTIIIKTLKVFVLITFVTLLFFAFYIYFSAPVLDCTGPGVNASTSTSSPIITKEDVQTSLQVAGTFSEGLMASGYSLKKSVAGGLAGGVISVGVLGTIGYLEESNSSVPTANHTATPTKGEEAVDTTQQIINKNNALVCEKNVINKIGDAPEKVATPNNTGVKQHFLNSPNEGEIFPKMDNTTFAECVRKFLPENYADGLAIRNIFHHFGEIGQFENITSTHNIMNLLGYTLHTMLFVSIFSIFIHFLIWQYKSYFVANFPKSIGRYVGNQIFYIIVTLNLIIICIDLYSMLQVIIFMRYDIIRMYIGVATDIQLGTTA